MAIVQSAAVAELGIIKQASEGTPGANPDYALPVYSGLPGPVQETSRFNVTDANNQYPGLFKTHAAWEADLVIPAFPASLGTFIKGVLPTDTKTGAGDPYSHAFTPAGSDAFFTLWSRRPGDLYERYADGLIEELSFSFSGDEPLKVGVKVKGKTATVLGSAYTAVNTEKYTQSGEYFTSLAGTLQLDVATTPATTTVVNIVSGTVRIKRQTDLINTAESLTPGLISRGRYEVGVALDTVWQNYDAYRATYYGATAGSAQSATIVMGSVSFKFVANGNPTNHDLTLAVPNLALLVPEPPAPDPSGAPFKVAIDGMAVQPTAGSIVTATLRNAVSAAY